MTHSIAKYTTYLCLPGHHIIIPIPPSPYPVPGPSQDSPWRVVENTKAGVDREAMVVNFYGVEGVVEEPGEGEVVVGPRVHPAGEAGVLPLRHCYRLRPVLAHRQV